MRNVIIERIRRNHALEHATINVLSQRKKRFSAQGNSSFGGFYLNIYGDISEEEVAEAVEEAHRRLRQGESNLALHPTCGTVLLTTATLATLSAQLVFSIESRRQGRDRFSFPVLLGALPSAVLAVTLTLIAARPVGMAVQRNVTVNPDIGDLQVIQVRRTPPSIITRLFQFLLGQAKNKQVKAFRVETR